MLDWLKNLIAPLEPEKPAMTPEDALDALQHLISDAAIDEIYDGLDSDPDRVTPEIRGWVEAGSLGEFPLHASVIWLAYQEGNNHRVLDAMLRSKLRDALIWAFQFELNTVLLGGSLGTLDGLEPADREELALDLLATLDTPRRYWLLMKVRTPAFIAAVGTALKDFKPGDERMSRGAFHQLTPAELPLIREHLNIDGPGAELYVAALSVMPREQVQKDLEALAASQYPNVRAQAERVLAN